jgi:hypothetical protein
MTWSLATYQRGDTIGLAVLREDGSVVAPPDLKRWATMLELLGNWAQAETSCAPSSSTTRLSLTMTVSWRRCGGRAR